jgi:isoleucyl-tRNA synthetase
MATPSAPGPARPAGVFARLSPSLNLPALESGVLALWERLDAFQESIRRRASAPPFQFYDGPPFATGTPHYGHLLQSTVKDIVPRYWTMRGYRVERRFGWDCHGLPIEMLAQNALKLEGPADIRAYGVDRFNEQCRAMVQTYVGEWRRTITRLGRWVDFDNDYKTMDTPFMESVWWVFRQLWDQGRIYRSHRIMAYDPVLATPLSNFEAGNNYKDVQDPALTVRFPVVGPSPFPAGAAFLAWTTTPWTLPSNLALCVNPDLDYCLVRERAGGSHLVLAEARLGAYWSDPAAYEVLARHAGAALKDLAYQPLFPEFAGTPKAFRVLCDAYVTTEDGTGIVHQAPAYGADDHRVCSAAGIALVDPLDEACRFTAMVPWLAGAFCKDADKAIVRRLKEQGSLWKHDTVVHSYPFGERSEAPLIQRPVEAWFVRVEDLRERMLQANAGVRWIPESVGSNRFGNWLKDAKDWNISRNRFWGSCIPVWVNTADPSDCICVGSIEELERLSGVRVADLHKHHLDQVVIRRGGATYQRTPEVLDCWFESGAMPYGQCHYPFEGKAAFESAFPANFIGEALDQTRGWFYTLMVISTALFGRAAYRNVVVTGLILAEDGLKLSKRKKNYPDPDDILARIGADALRAYMIDSPVVRGEPMRFSESGLSEIVRTVVLPYWNAVSFFTTYAAVDGYDPSSWMAEEPARRPEMDRWALSNLQSLIRDVNREMEAYRLDRVVPRLVAFIGDLTNWYIRRTRERFWRNAERADQAAAYATLHQLLTTFARVLAPFMPFLTEEVHQRLVRPIDPQAPASVHWCDYPQADEALIDQALEARMAICRTVSALGRRLREDHKLKVRQPLPRVTVISRDAAVRAAAEAQSALIADELNVKAVSVSSDEGAVCAIAVKPNFAALRSRAGPRLKAIAAELGRWGHAEVAELEAGRTISVAGEPLALGDVLLQRTPNPGSAVASEGPITVMLDTAITPALAREGLAREVISILQQARKAANLEVSDRIRVAFRTEDPELGAALAEHAAAIASELLASEFAASPSLGAGAQRIEVNGRALSWELAKV